VIRQGEFLEQLQLCDALITLSSVTAFEAILYDKPVMILNLAARFYPYVGIQEDAVAEVTREADVFNVLKKILYDRTAQEKLKLGRLKVLKIYGPPDPHADPCKIFKEFIQLKLKQPQSVGI
jgi:hypothetical protein